MHMYYIYSAEHIYSVWPVPKHCTERRLKQPQGGTLACGVCCTAALPPPVETVHSSVIPRWGLLFSDSDSC